MPLGARALLCVAGGLLAACAPRAELQLGASSAPVLEALPALAAHWPLAGAPPSPPRLVAARAGGLSGGVLEPGGEARFWQREAELSAPPLLAGNLVLVGEGARLQALDAASGAPLWSVPRAGAHSLALADDGQLSALVLEDARGQRRWLSVIDRAGTERFRIDDTPELGTPALRAGVLLLPWGGRFASVIELASGSELARAGVATSLRHALWAGDVLVLAGPPWVPLTTAAQDALALPARPLPGRVELGGGALLGSAGPELTRLFARPGGAAQATSVLATYGRLAMSFDGERGGLEWLAVSPGVILGAALGDDHVALCDASGGVRILSRDGARVLGQLRLGRARRGQAALSSCALSAPPSWPEQAGEAATARPNEPLVEQLARVLATSDPELSSAQRFLSRELAVRPEPEATRALIALASRQSADPILQTEAEDLLATRRNGAEFMLQALERSGPRSADPVARPPVAALADALLALEEKSAAPLLAAQMNRVGHSPASLARVARALEQLASEAEFSALQVFFSVRRTSADPPELVEAVIVVGRTLLRIGAAPGRRLVQWAARDPLTAPEVRAQLEAELQRTALK